MSMLSKAIHRFNPIPIKITMKYFTELEQIFQKLIWNHKRPHVAPVILRKKNKVEESCYLISNYTIRSQWSKPPGTSIKTDWYWHKNIDQWNKIKSPEINPYHYSQLIFDRGRKHMQWAKNHLFNIIESWIHFEFILVCCKNMF